MHRRLGCGESRVAGEDTPHAPRAFAEPRALGQLWCAGSGTAKVASRARIRPNCSASVRRPPSLRSTPGQRSLGSTLVRRLGGGKSRVAGEDTPRAPRAFADPRAFGQRWGRGLWGRLSCTGTTSARVRQSSRPNIARATGVTAPGRLAFGPKQCGSWAATGIGDRRSQRRVGGIRDHRHGLRARPETHPEGR